MNGPERVRRWPALFPALLVGGVGAALVWALWSLSPQAPGLGRQVRERLAESGVQAEVTAVLLNFRGYDTLLELAVLLAALLGAWYLERVPPLRGVQTAGPVVQSLVRVLVPAMIMVAGYLLWLGGHASGGAFQAGALLAAACVMLMIVQEQLRLGLDSGRLRLLLVVGPAVFVMVAGGVMVTGGSLLQYPPEHAGLLILLIEVASAISIAVTLMLLFAGGRANGGGGE
jgi:multisubunit Na+/H+ antiporter MnhB subunit